MSKLFEKMLARSGKSVGDFRANSKIGRALRRRGVPPHPEIDRVVGLPRRRWEEQPTLEELQEVLTEHLKVPGGQEVLRPGQAAALMDIADLGGLLAPLPVGAGKTLVSRCAPLMLDGIERPVLLVPGGMKKETQDKFRAMDANWRAHPNMKIVSYEKLSNVKSATLLFDLQPDMLVCDEVHKLKNIQAGCTRRVAAYMDEFPKTVFVGMSGTVIKRSLMDFHHLSLWALGDQSPLPVDRRIAWQWALAVDEKVDMAARLAPGALEVFVEEVETVTQQEVREGLGRRIRETPGIVAQKSGGCAASILLKYWHPKISLEVNELAEKACQKHIAPGGGIILDPVELWRHIRELVCGFYYTFEEEPPKKWLVRRRAWRKLALQILMEGHPGVDTEAAVKGALRRGELPYSTKTLDAWEEVRRTYTLKNRAVWLDTSVLEQAIKKAEGHGMTLVWVEYREVGHKLSEMTGWPFFYSKGLCKGRPISDWAGQTIILSVNSNKEGRNLQHDWNKNLIVNPMSDGAVFQQLIGRTHRSGQEADEVLVEVMLGHPVLMKSMEQAFADANLQQPLMGEPHKLLLADVCGELTSPSVSEDEAKTKEKTNE